MAKDTKQPQQQFAEFPGEGGTYMVDPETGVHTRVDPPTAPPPAVTFKPGEPVEPIAAPTK